MGKQMAVGRIYLLKKHYLSNNPAIEQSRMVCNSKVDAVQQ